MNLVIQNPTKKELYKTLNLIRSQIDNHLRNGFSLEDAIVECIMQKNLNILRNRYKKEYRIFYGIRTRTTNKKDNNYKRGYGEIGISDDWLGRFGFVHFIRDVGPMPNTKERWTIDRVDNSKGYIPGNCRWATYTQQNRNKKNNIWVEINGEKRLASDVAKENGIGKSTLSQRINVYGWDIIKAVTTPVERRCL